MRLYARLAFVIVSLLVLGASAARARTAATPPTDLFFSEYVEGSSNNKALEIYNGTGASVDLAAGGYAVKVYFNGNPSAGLTVGLTGTVASGDVYVLAQSSAAPAILAQADQVSGAGWFNGDDAVALVKGTATLDVIGQIGFDPGSEWGTGLTSTADDTLRRMRSVVAGDPDGSDAFDPSAEWVGFPTDTFDGLGSHTTGDADAPPTVASTTPAAGADSVEPDASVTVTFGEDVAVADGWYAIDCTTSGEHAAAVSGGPRTFTLDPDADFARSETCTVTIRHAAVTDLDADDPPDAMAADFAWSFDTVRPPLTIGEVQGETRDDEDGATDASPYAGQTVTVGGVVAQNVLQSNGNHGFFLQSTAAGSDGDPLTSDGVFVFHGRFSTLLRVGGGAYVPHVGDEVVLRGPVAEFFGQTELSNPRLVELVSSGVDAVPAPFVADPPADIADAARYWERREGMQAQVPAGSVVLNGRNVFAPADSEIWFARGDSEIAQRSDAYARRAFRDPHPLDDVPSQLFDNGNGYRILVGSFGVKAAAGDPAILLTPSRTFDTLTNAPAGGVYFDFGKYSIQVAEQPQLVDGVDPSRNAPPQSFVRAKEYSIASFNVENLYDYRDDPNDGCDFAGNAGCPGVSPPFDYVPASDEAYQARLHDIARQIAGALHAPDLILVQEAEDQDICAVADGSLACGSADGADGKPDTLQELALAVAEVGGPAYDTASDRDGADDRGIVSGFLYRTDRVELEPASAADPVLGSSPQVAYRGEALAYNGDVQNPKALNAVLPADVDRSTGVDGDDVFTRAPQVGHFRVWRVGVGRGTFVDLYAISNHFSSGPDARVGQRTEQAAYDAAIVDALEAADPDAKVALGGDLNVYPRPDDPFPDDPSDQLGPLYDQGLSNLWDTIVAQVPEAAYSYVFEGQAQTLDQLFVTDSLLADLVVARHAHVNSDWPADEPGDGPYGTSDHDPLVARFRHVPTHAGGTVR